MPLDSPRRRRHDEIEFETHEPGGKARQPRELSLSEPILDDDVLSLDITEIAQSLAEGRVAWRVGSSRQIADAREPLSRRLRLARDRRKKQAERKSDREPNPPHGHLAENG